MSDTQHKPNQYFSPESYRAILERAQLLGYRITPFKEFTPPLERPVLLLRHDLDHSIRSAAFIAEIEADLGIRSTYFVQTECEFYNLLSSESRSLLRRIATQGHEIGLHYDTSRYIGPRGRVHLNCDLVLLEDITEQKVVSASQHIPIDSERIDMSQFIENEAYESRFTEAPMTYISDSLMVWRQTTPYDLLDQQCSFQLLTHPMKWSSSFASMDEALQHALEEECRSLRMSYTEIARRYRKLLRDRSRLDADFQARRSRR